MPASSRDNSCAAAHHRAVKIALALALLCPALAYAEERSTTITFSGMVGGIEHEMTSGDYYLAEPDPLVGPRMTLSWEHAALTYPDQPGYKFDGAIVPELVGGAFIDDDRARGFIGAGLRAELRMAQREMGLFKVSARGAVYLAGRGLVVGDDRKPFGEFALGEYFLIGKTMRIGFEGSLVVTSEQPMDYYDADTARIGGIMQVFIGWQP
jgi:hypothetical protein